MNVVVLKEITRENLENVLNLKVSDAQAGFVSANAVSLAQAWVYRETAFPFAVYAGDTPVGFVMLGYYETKRQYTLWKFMIDEKYQGRGYGKAALRLAIAYLADRFRPDEIFTGVAYGNTAAETLYHSFGFRRTGVFDETQIEMRLKIE